MPSSAARCSRVWRRTATRRSPSSMPARSRWAPATTIGCVGSLAGIYTASMPAFVVENRAFGNVAFCNIYEGSNPRRLNYGVYDEGVRERLLLVQNEIVPVIAEALRQSGGIPLKPIIKRALGMGDELHSRNTAAALLFLRELVPGLLALAVLGQREDRPRGQDHGRRPVFLFAPVHGGEQGDRRRRARHRGLERRDGHGIQLPRLLHPRERARRHLVQGAACLGRGQAVRGPQRGRDHLDGWRKHHRRDDRPWRFRPSLGPLARRTTRAGPTRR